MSTTFARILAAAGLAPTSVDGLPVDPVTGPPASNTQLDDLMADPADLDSIRCDTGRGVSVHPHDALRAALAGYVRRVVFDSKGCVVDYGRTKRLFEGPARDAAKLLVRRCEHPGCDLPTDWSHVDHDIEWGDDGNTDQGNAGILCGRHNTARHHLGLQRRQAMNGVSYTVRADDTVILPVGARTPGSIEMTIRQTSPTRSVAKRTSPVSAFEPGAPSTQIDVRPHVARCERSLEWSGVVDMRAVRREPTS